MSQPADRKSKTKRGDNRRDDVQRSAEELDALTKFIHRLGKSHWSYEQRLMGLAGISRALPDCAFRALVVRQFTADFGTGKNSFAGKETLAEILGWSVSKVRRADKALVDAGFATERRRKRETTIFNLISPPDVDARLAELIGSDIQDRSDLNAQEAQDRSDLDGLTVQDRSDLEIKTAQIWHPTSTLYLDEEEEECIHARDKPEVDFGKGLQVSKPLDLGIVLTVETSRQFREVCNAWGAKPGEPLLNAFSLQHAESFLAESLKRYDGEDAAIVQTAVQDVVLGMAAKVAAGEVKPGAKWNAALNYFTKSLSSALQRLKLDAEKTNIELSGLREREAIKTETARTASAKNLASLDRHHAVNEEAAARRAANSRKSANGAKSSASEPDRFNPDKPAGNVHGCFVSGDDANDLLDEIDGATRKMVRKALEEASGASDRTFKASNGLGYESPNAKVELKRIKDWCRDWLRRELAYQKYGTPEQLCGGAIARLNDKPLKSERGAISERFIQRLQTEYPDAWGERSCSHARLHYEDPHAYRAPVEVGESEIERIFQTVVREVFFTQRKEKWSWDEYGPDAQRQLEEAFSAKIAELDASAKAIVKANAEFEERKEQAEAEREERRKVEAAEAAERAKADKLEEERRREEEGVYWEDGILKTTPEFEKILIERSGKSSSAVFDAVTQASHVWRTTCSFYNDITRPKSDILKRLNITDDALEPFSTVSV